MKKLLSLVAALGLTFSMAACGSTDNGSNATEQGGDTTQAPSSQVVEGAIDVVSREAGSGTRSAFEEIIGFNGEDQDPLTANATIKDGNGVVATYVEGNDASIGYVSFVTLEKNHGKINGLTVDGVEPTAENVLSGEYSVARPFKMVYMEENITDVERAFIDFLASTDGLEILESKGTIVDTTNAEAFNMSKYGDLSGNIVMGGSTSTEDAVKALAEEFTALFPKVTYTYDATG
ncbi:MAG: substrate-binding domain-containing protein, partial [Turicibacter sp.]|nr:substrate-binding domain-containing protein [Turicibacter sp.]